MYATTSAVIREMTYASAPPVLRFKGYTVRLFPVGGQILIVSNLIVLLVFCFYKLNLKDQWQWENVGYRTGYMTVCQLPLLFLLAGKNNIVGFLTGSSHERLNWLHRWVSRTLFLTATIHMGYWFADWARFDYIGVKVKTDLITQKGLGAWAILAWIILSSFSPVRGWCYEFFVLQHLISFTAFTVMVYIHTPSKHHVWIWIPVGLFFFDRLLRAGNILYNNLSVFHRRQCRTDGRSAFWACKAELTPLSQDITRISICDPPISWTAGQHVFLSCHSIVPLQSHPFTIASLPEDGRLEILIRAQRGGTLQLFGHAEKNHVLPTVDVPVKANRMTNASIEGPYGRIRPLRQFDSVVLIAGGIGATFTVPLMREIVGRWRQSGSSELSNHSLFGNIAGAATRRIVLVWVVRSANDSVGWFDDQFGKALEAVCEMQDQGQDIDLKINIYQTCDENFANEQNVHQTQMECAPAECAPEAMVSSIEDEKQKHSEPDGVKTVTREIVVQKDDQDGPGCGQTEEGCCCRKTITDEDAIVAPCTCGDARIINTTFPPSPSSSSSSSTTTLSTSQPHNICPISKVPITSGRPPLRSIIQRTLEHAEGETAVVVCGSSGLTHDVRNMVVALSDERAIHKGSGALAVWLHCERYTY